VKAYRLRKRSIVVYNSPSVDEIITMSAHVGWPGCVRMGR